ncbi:MAG: DUF4148 domain-containing protein, partial [Rhodoferax sp.]
YSSFMASMDVIAGGKRPVIGLFDSRNSTHFKGTFIMKTRFFATALIATTALFVAAPSFAGLSREQVKTELAEAVLTGNMPAPGDQGLNLNEMYPDRYPAKVQGTGLTREQVKEELAEAIRTGNMPTVGDRGLNLNEMYPDQYPSKTMQASKTREQVQAELAEAIRTGSYMVNDQGVLCYEMHPGMHPTV